ncbi:MAG: hypothetical protein ACFFG0_54490 [Candidatus Thorarchaeota archaeon]
MIKTKVGNIDVGKTEKKILEILNKSATLNQEGIRKKLKRESKVYNELNRMIEKKLLEKIYDPSFMQNYYSLAKKGHDVSKKLGIKSELVFLERGKVVKNPYR